MAYIKLYNTQFADIDDNPIKVVISADDGNPEHDPFNPDEWIQLDNGKWMNIITGEIVDELPQEEEEQEDEDNSEELIPEGTPLEITYDMSSDVFKPIRYSGASLKLLLQNPKFDVYQGEITRIKVDVFKNNEIFWSGFITPCIYSQPYSRVVDEVSLEAIDRLSALQYMQFGNGKTIETTYNVIKYILGLVNDDKFFDKIYVQRKLSINGSTDLMNTIYLQQMNFYDEEDEALKCDEILEYIMAYLGLTMVQWKNDLYCVDMTDVYNNSAMTFNVYTLSSSTPTTETIQFPTYILNSGVTCGDDTCEIELDEVYNKVTVVDNLLEYSDLIKNITDTGITQYLEKYPNNVDGDISKLTIKDSSYDPNARDTEYICYNAFYKLQSNSYATIAPQPYSVTFANTKRCTSNSISAGTFFQVSYKEFTNGEFDNNPSISTAITYLHDRDKGEVQNPTYVVKHCVDASYDNYRIHIMRFFNPTTMFFNAGDYIVLDMNYKLSNQANYQYANHFYDPENSSTTSTTYYDNTEISVYPQTLLVVINATLKVGDYYYTRTYNRGLTGNTGIWNQDWKTEYDETLYRADFPYTEGWTTAATQFQFLTILHAGDNFDNLKLDNEVSYTFNKSNESGILIRLPNFNIQGTVQFSIDEVLNLHNWTTINYTQTTGDNRYDGTFPFPVRWSGPNTGEQYHYVERWVTGDTQSQGYLYVPRMLNYIILKAFHLTSISMKYVIPNDDNTDFDFEEDDVRYTNIINEKYVKEARDITLYINTFDFKHSSYSFALIRNGNEYAYLNNVNNDGNSDIMEHHIIQRYVDHYSLPKVKYSNTFNNTDLNPFTKIYVQSLGRTFLANDAEYQMRLDKVKLNLTEYKNKE